MYRFFSTRFIVVAYGQTYIQDPNVNVYIMNLSSLNVDVQLYLLKFVEAVDRFNLALSGILKGFENVNRGINLQNRYSEHFTCDVSSNQIVTYRVKHCKAELGLRRNSLCELEIRLVFRHRQIEIGQSLC